MNFLWASKVFDVRTYLVNGRISDRNFSRSKHLKFFYKALLRNVDACLMQTDIDAERITALGAERVKVLGNCKFDQALDIYRKALKINPENPEIFLALGNTCREMENFDVAGLPKTTELIITGIGIAWQDNFINTF